MQNKSLIIYFSHTGENYMADGIKNITKGNTEIVAEMIQEITGADLFKVESLNQYPFDYRKCCDVAKKELVENIRPEIKNYLSDINEYDVIYIGFPIWWNEPPMPIFTLLEKLNFEGKTIMPFSTHEGSGLGNSANSIKKTCIGANVMPGLAIRGSFVDSAKSKIEKWLNK